MTKLISQPISVRPIKTEDDFNSAIARLHSLAMVGFEDGSPEDDEYSILQTLADEYQVRHHPIPPPHPIEAIKFMMDQKGISESEVSRLLGGRSRKSEIFSQKRKLSLEMMRKLSSALGISADILVQPY